MIVIGLDPGLNFTGWGVLSFTASQPISLVGSGVISTKGLGNENEKLYLIYEELISIASQYEIAEASIEKVFINSNPRSSMSLCYARAASIISMMHKGIKIYEYASTAVKKCVTGSGMAGKEQVAFMVRTTLGLNDETVFNHHSSDALATAICHAYNSRNRSYYT
ncbi:MAG: crossover junction endodeoxyribonuclease RuvC [Anaplasma sp.]